MKKIEEVIVVEGESDRQFLLSFLEADIVITNGSAISEETLSLLENIAKKRTIIVLTDPDFPGKQIREKIQNRVKNCKHCYIEKSKAIKGKKVGIAQTKKEDILEALEHLITYKESKDNLTMNDLFSSGLIGPLSTKKKDKIISYYHLDKSNGKSLLKKLNMLDVSKEDIKRILKE